MSTPRQNIRALVVEIFPWLERVGLTAKGDLEIKSATEKIEVAGGGAAVHRVGDAGDAGSVNAAANVITYTAPDGTSWTLTFTIVTGAIVIVRAPLVNPSSVGKILTKATEGSERVTSG